MAAVVAVGGVEKSEKDEKMGGLIMGTIGGFEPFQRFYERASFLITRCVSCDPVGAW